MKLHKIYRSSKMAHGSWTCGLLLFASTLILFVRAGDDDTLEYMSKQERDALKEEARDMFYHAYNAYMDNAYPADELMPLSCKGRYRGSEPNRGDIDTALGNFSLTLVDTLDTLVLLGDLEEFQNAVKLVMRDVSFDTDVIVSVFETNIRMLGGLLSGHILAEYLQLRADIMPWYTGELLDLAKELGYKLLPAFNTTTGIPYGRINLKHGLKGIPAEAMRETCTACAGSMILEMAALSRLTGEPIFEEKAQKAMDSLWRMRHRGTDLMGSVLNVNSGDWVRRDSGVGAGIDSYYEYCLKAYILLGDEKYLGRFNRHYQAVMKYISQGPMLLDVHMHRPNTNSKNFMDALLAFWPGLQVLKGDIKPAVETHEMLYQVMQRHNFIPEAFTTDFQVHWGHHPLRPEFLESTYFLYRATGDHYYLGVGRKVLKSLQTYARVPCGYAAVSDVRTNKHDDTMDSFVLSETFKYLFLLFAESSDLILDPDEFVFTTEGHLLPLTLASIGTNSSSAFEKDMIDVDAFDRTCPNSLHLFPASVRQPLRNMVEDVCPRRTPRRRLNAAQFQVNNLEHLSLLSDMGITILTQSDGRVQLLHTFANAKTPQDAEEGLLFMQEMVEMNKMHSQQSATKPQVVTFTSPTYWGQKVTLLAGPAHFGPELRGPSNRVTGKVVYAEPATACEELQNADALVGKIVIMDRGSCMFVEKARRIQKAGALGGIVLDNVSGSSAATFPMFAMSGDGNEADHVVIPVVFLFNVEATRLLEAAIFAGPGLLTVTIGEHIAKDEIQLKAPNDLSMFEKLKGSLKEFLVRQISPQESPELFSKRHYSTGNADSLVTKEAEIIRDEDRKIIVEYQHLKAEIPVAPDVEKIRITANLGKSLQPPPEPQNLSEFERKWRFLRKMIVNQIFANTHQGSSLNITGPAVEHYYNRVQKERGIEKDGTEKTNLSVMVVWFLKELSEMGLDLSVAEKTKELANINRRRLELLKQHLLSKMDDINFLKNVAIKFKVLKLMNPEMEILFKEVDSGNVKVENYALFGKLLQEIFKGEEDHVNRHVNLLDQLHQAIQNNKPSGLVLDQLAQELFHSFDSELDEKMNVKLVTEREANTKNGIPKKSAKEVIIVPEHKKNGQTHLGNSASSEDFILIEIDKGEQKVEENSSVDDTPAGIPLTDLNSKDTEKTPQVREPESDVQTQNESQNVEIHRNDIEVLVKGAEFLKSIDLTDAPEIHDERQKLLREIQRELSGSQSNKKTGLNLKHSKAESVTTEENRSKDLLEDYKKPVWASDEGKVTKEFSEFQRKPEVRSPEYKISQKTKFRYEEKEQYTASQDKKDVDEIQKHKPKHIDDEL